jgi:hypothetical protein
MPCTPIHLFVLFNNGYKMQLQVPQFANQMGFHKIISPFGYGIAEHKIK